MAAFQSVVLDCQSGQTNQFPTTQLTISMQASLSILRSQTCFTSALIMVTKESPYLLGLELHYQRLHHAYTILFGRTDFPVSFEQWQTSITAAIEVNKHLFTHVAQCTIFCVAGQASSEPYHNGFGGSLQQLIIKCEAFQGRPQWCVEQGLHLITHAHDRPLATAKTTCYLGGVIAQHACDSLSVLTCLYRMIHATTWERSRQWVCQQYQSCSNVAKHALNLYINTCMATNHVSDNIPSAIPQSLYTLCKTLTSKQLTHVQIELNRYPNEYIHEAVFVTDNSPRGYLLEGSTFSLMAINTKKDIVMCPLEGNKQTSDQHSGQRLNSTSLHILRHVIKQSGLTVIQKPIQIQDIGTLKGLYAISTRRICDITGSLQLQPCRSLDGHVLPVTTPDYIKTIKEAWDVFCHEYSYRVSL